MHRSKPAPLPGDPALVDVSASNDMRFWTRNLGVSETRLRDAVARVGNQSRDVRAELRRKRGMSERALG